jgi:hypothetical protein
MAAHHGSITRGNAACRPSRFQHVARYIGLIRRPPTRASPEVFDGDCEGWICSRSSGEFLEQLIAGDEVASGGEAFEVRSQGSCSATYVRLEPTGAPRSARQEQM